MADIKDLPDGELRALADCRAISSADYVDEMDRRAGRVVIDAPPLDYALDDELAIPYLHHDHVVTGDEETQPAPPALMWIAGIVATLVVVALWMVL